MEYANKLKYELAKAESNITGELIETIYLRKGGLLTGDVKKVKVSIEDPEEPKKAVKKVSKKK